MSDVIAAISTGVQISAIGILRLSGDGCAEVAGKVFLPQNGKPLSQVPARKLVLGELKDAKGRVIDQCLAVYSPAPRSYTGEDTVELQCHGSPAVLSAGLEALYLAGARPARRGEFTKRAFLNGQMDLTQAEAVIDLIEAESADAAANAAGQVGGALLRQLAPIYDSLTDICSHFHAVLDYPDEDIDDFALSRYTGALQSAADTLDALLATFRRGQILKRGVLAAIAGRPNVGKSSLLNALAGYERVIVTDVAGTTRDTVEEVIQLGHTRLRLLDTAGIRQTEDPIEAMGVQRALSAAETADLALFVCDGSQPLTAADEQAMIAAKKAPFAVALVNKSDLPRKLQPEALPFAHILFVSAKTGEGLEELSRLLAAHFETGGNCDGSILTNVRQQDALRRAREGIACALEGLTLGYTPDAVLTDVEIAMEAMGEITGKTVREDITNRIFERFCVGK